MTTPKEVVITGIGVVSPIGIGADAYWEGLVDGQCGIGDLDHIDRHSLPFDFGGQLSDFDPKAYVRPRKSLKVMSREISTAYSACVLAMEHGGMTPASAPSDRIATVFGSEMLYGEPCELYPAAKRCLTSGEFDISRWGESAMREIYPLWMLKYLPNMAACHVGIALGAHGPNNTIVMQDASGLSALGEAVNVIHRDHADTVVVCSTGTRINLTRLLYRGDYRYASRRDPVQTSSRPFCSDRDGVVGGEGAGAFIIESLEHALTRNAQPIARVAGIGNHFIQPKSRGAEKALTHAMHSAMSRAGVESSEIGIAISHAMGDEDVDRIDAQVHQACVPNAVLCAPKGATGHTGAGCGIMELAAGALSLQHGLVPPTVNGHECDKSLNVNVVTEPTPTNSRAVIQSNHTPSGHAVSAVLTKL